MCALRIGASRDAHLRDQKQTDGIGTKFTADAGNRTVEPGQTLPNAAPAATLPGSPSPSNRPDHHAMSPLPVRQRQALHWEMFRNDADYVPRIE
jgi:hypothetical protein